MSDNRPRVLVVDDEGPIRELIARALSNAGMHATATASAVEAQDHLEVEPFDLLISDIRMPGKHGHSLMVESMEKYPGLTVVAITGLAEPRIVMDLLERGVDDVIFKPFDYSLFAAKMKGLLRRPKPKEEASVTSVAQQITAASDALNTELERITQNFKDTISKLERQRDTLENGYIGSVRVLSNLVSQVESTGTSHAARVEKLALAIAERAGITGREELRDLRIAALLHEIGTFGMPDEIRSKAPWTLSQTQLASYRRYPVIGATLLSEVPGSQGIVDLIENHTENFDGSGFPEGRRGKEIPLAARVIRIADGCDTMMMYTDRDSAVNSTREHVRAHAGKAYDPELVQSAFRLIPETQLAAPDRGVKEISAYDLMPGAVLAENLYDADGRFLAREGAEINKRMLPRLKSLLRDQTVRVQAEPGKDNV